MTHLIAELRQQFAMVFGDGGRIHVIRAPGRVNLIGEHTDYNDGFVFPMAIEPQVQFVCRERADGHVRVSSTAFPGDIVEFSVDARPESGEPTWANYCRGVTAELLGAGIPLTGMDLLISNSLPIGGGLSSSAAMEVGTATCFLTLAGQEMDKMRLALLCQRAEHEYAHVPCGMMDQMIVATGEEGHATLFDCRSLTKQYIPIDSNQLRVVVINSMVKHELSGSEYADRRKQCEQGVAYFQQARPQVKALRDVTLTELEENQSRLPGVIYRRCRHVVSENQRTVEAAAAIKAKRYDRAGVLMNESHDSLRDDYEVSCPELDFLAAEAITVAGVFGARMTGGGFGGCIVALAQPTAVESLIAQVSAAYLEKFHLRPTAFVTTATAGASVMA